MGWLHYMLLVIPGIDDLYKYYLTMERTLVSLLNLLQQSIDRLDIVTNKYTPLLGAAAAGQYGPIASLIEVADPNVVGPDGRTALHLSAQLDKHAVEL